jgi:hypothetical protein
LNIGCNNTSGVSGFIDQAGQEDTYFGDVSFTGCGVGGGSYTADSIASVIFDGNIYSGSGSNSARIERFAIASTGNTSVTGILVDNINFNAPLYIQGGTVGNTSTTSPDCIVLVGRNNGNPAQSGASWQTTIRDIHLEDCTNNGIIAKHGAAPLVEGIQCATSFGAGAACIHFASDAGYGTAQNIYDSTGGTSLAIVDDTQIGSGGSGAVAPTGTYSTASGQSMVDHYRTSVYKAVDTGMTVAIATAGSPQAMTPALGTSGLPTNKVPELNYEIHADVNCTVSSASATATLNVVYTDTSNTAQTLSGTATCTTLGAASVAHIDQTVRIHNNSKIQYYTTIVNTPTYDVAIYAVPLTTF